MSGDDEARDADRRDAPDEAGGGGDADGSPNATADEGTPAEPRGTAELTAFLAATYPDRGLDGDGDEVPDESREDRRDRLRERVTDLREAAEALRDVDLSNGDEPATTFTPYRGADGDGGGTGEGDGTGEGRT